MKFKWRLFFTYLLVVLVPFLGAQVYLADTHKERLIAQTEQRLLKEAFLIRTVIEKGQGYARGPAAVDRLVKVMGKDIGDRITVIDRRGTVLGDSEVAAGAVKDMEDHSNRPEFIAAFKQSHGMAIRHSVTLGIDMMYLAVKLEHAGRFVGVVRVAVPLTQIRELTRKTEVTLFSAFLVCVFFILVLNIVASKELSRPIEEVTRAAEKIAEGDFDVRVHPSAKGEFEALSHAINVMAAEIEERINEITEEKETLTTILGDMSDGVMVVDAQGRITLINRALEGLLGDRADVVGKAPVEVIRSAELQDGLAAVLRGEGTFETALCMNTGGADRIFDVTIAPLKPMGRMQGAVAVFHDITVLKRIDKVRRDFVANVSHELRTPLTSVKGYAETLTEGQVKDEAQVRRFARIILKHANRLSRLVEDLLSLTRLEAEGSTPKKTAFRLKDVIEASVQVVRPAAEAKGITLAVEDMADQLAVRADRDQISQAVINLLDNGVKYTPEGGKVTVAVIDTADAVQVTVRDTGFGIARDDLERIFERFYRVDKSRLREAGGTGLGLSIVKHIIQGHGGKLWVESELEEGSAFHFTLPKDRSTESGGTTSGTA
ncbi:MAG: PAS domain-containing protein [Deltaproteobacteria bacterium]|nr:PAS domain-containing protein [Deltaproteobacteria bacterium]